MHEYGHTDAGMHGHAHMDTHTHTSAFHNYTPFIKPELLLSI